MLTWLSSRWYETGSDSPMFQPIPELVRDDADVVLFFLMANAVNFVQPVDDELFAAHRRISASLSGAPDGKKVYLTDEPVHVLGCAAQTQICLNSSLCTPLTGELPASNLALNMTLTEKQKYTLDYFIVNKGQRGSNLYSIVGDLGPAALLARDSKAAGIQGPLSSNQWKLEVQHWQATLMALLQRQVVDFATGPSDPSLERLVTEPPDKVKRYVCQSQVSNSQILGWLMLSSPSTCS